MKLKRVEKDGEVIFYDAATNTEIRREGKGKAPAYRPVGIVTALYSIGVIILILSVIGMLLSFANMFAAVGLPLTIAGIFSSIIFFALGKIIELLYIISIKQ